APFVGLGIGRVGEERVEKKRRQEIAVGRGRLNPKRSESGLLAAVGLVLGKKQRPRRAPPLRSSRVVSPGDRYRPYVGLAFEDVRPCSSESGVKAEECTEAVEFHVPARRTARRAHRCHRARSAKTGDTGIQVQTVAG